MRFGLGCTAVCVLFLSAGAFAGEKINSKESLRVCKAALSEEQQKQGVEYKVKRKTATSVDKDAFKHWINVVETKAGEKSSIKVLCQTSRTGEVLELTKEAGRWTF